jgi:hypothetical protein
MVFQSRAAQTTLLATGSALVLLLAAVDDHAHAEANLDVSYTISFARIRVGDIAATVVFGDNEYAISARGRAGGVMRVLVMAKPSPRAAPSRTVIPCRQLLPLRSSPIPKFRV